MEEMVLDKVRLCIDKATIFEFRQHTRLQSPVLSAPPSSLAPGLVGPSSLALNLQRRALHRPLSITTKKVDGNNNIEASRRWPPRRRMRWTVR